MTEQERELDLLVADVSELEQENRLLRARNERLEAELQAAMKIIAGMADSEGGEA
jgi:cell division septum initiation protein DivIVA